MLLYNIRNIMSVSFVHSVKEMHLNNGKKTIHEEYMLNGEKGLYIKYFDRVDDKTKKIVILNKNGKYIIKEDGEAKEDQTKADVDAFIKKNKSLSWAKSLVEKAGVKRIKKN